MPVKYFPVNVRLRNFVTMDNTRWKRHPKFTELQISSDGSDFKYYDKLLNIKDHKGKTGRILKVVYINRSYYSVPKLILETYVSAAPADGRYYAQYKDGNIENLHPNNLFWSRSQIIPENRKFENSLKLSKLTKEQTYQAYHEYMHKGNSISALAKQYNVSDMAVHRAIQRFRRKLSSTKKPTD
jgi:hypothetical protein